MMVVADRLKLNSGLLRQRLAELSGSPNSATPPPTADGLAPIPQLELTAIRLASQTDDRRDLWWLDPLLYADPRARSVALALRHAATVAEAFKNLEDKDRPALLVAATERALAGDHDEIAARLSVGLGKCDDPTVCVVPSPGGEERGSLRVVDMPNANLSGSSAPPRARGT